MAANPLALVVKTAPAWTARDLIFDLTTHTSRLPDGTLIPHVTDVLASTGVAVDYTTIAPPGSRLERILIAGRDRGTAVHADCHAYDDDDLDWTTVDPRVRPFVDAWVACRDALGLIAILHARERQVFHPIYRYTGIQDGLFRLPDERIVLVDLKGGDPRDAAAEFQTAAYEAAYLVEHPGERIDRRWAIQLIPGRRVPYRVTDYSAWPDVHLHFPKFCAFLTTYHEQASRRLGAVTL